MPRVRKLAPEPFFEVPEVMEKYRKRSGLTVMEFCKKLDIDKDVYYRRRKSPELFTLGELRRIRRTLGIPLEEMNDVTSLL